MLQDLTETPYIVGGATIEDMPRIATMPALAVLVVVGWAIPVGEYLYYGAVSAISVVTASMFTAMLIAFPLLNGRRLHAGHTERAVMCRDCHALRWPNDLHFGFCIHCGSMRPAIPATMA
jgi:hypothetical protein